MVTVKIEKYIALWKTRGYSNDIPDECPVELENLKIVPSYRLIAKCLLSNDHGGKSLGFTQDKSKWYGNLKRIEIAKREGLRVVRQKSIFKEFGDLILISKPPLYTTSNES